MNPFYKNPPQNSVGIVIPMRDNLKFFKLAFHSVLSFTEHPYMLTIIDNMSSFTTKKYLRATQKNHNANVLSYQEDFNFAAQVNQGLRYMFSFPQVEYGIVLHSDVVVSQRWVSGLLNVMSLDDSFGVIGPISNTSPDEQKQWVKGGAYAPVKSGLSSFCMMFKKEVFQILKGFDEGYVGGGYEDLDFCRRAEKFGWKCAATGDVYVHHFGGATRALEPRSGEAMKANKKRFEIKFPTEEIEQCKMSQTA